MLSDLSGRARRQVGLIEFEGKRRAKTNDGEPSASVLDKSRVRDYLVFSSKGL